MAVAQVFCWCRSQDRHRTATRIAQKGQLWVNLRRKRLLHQGVVTDLLLLRLLTWLLQHGRTVNVCFVSRVSPVQTALVGACSCVCAGIGTTPNRSPMFQRSCSREAAGVHGPVGSVRQSAEALPFGNRILFDEVGETYRCLSSRAAFKVKLVLCPDP